MPGATAGSIASPHAGQNRASSGSAAPHLGHAADRAAPHDAQKRFSGAFEAPQAAHVFTAASLAPDPFMTLHGPASRLAQAARSRRSNMATAAAMQTPEIAASTRMSVPLNPALSG